MKRILSSLLAAVLLLSVVTMLSMTAGAVEADFADTGVDTIRSVAVTGVDIPKPNAMPAYGATVPTGKGYQVNMTTLGTTMMNGVSWYNVSDGKAMNLSDRFVSGKQYKALVYLQPTSNSYEFATFGLTATLNTHSAAIEGVLKESLCISYTYTCRSVTYVGSVSVNVTAPVAGQNPSYTCSIPSGDGYSINDVTDDLYQDGVQWGRISNGSYHWISPSTAFEEGEQYMVTVLLKPTDDYCRFNENVTGTVNGNTATVKKSFANPDNIYIEYTFTCQSDTPKFTVGGTVTSYLDNNANVTVRLRKSGSWASRSQTITGNTASFSFSDLSAGSYTYSVMKENHVTRTGTINVNSNKLFYVKICPLGDADLNGKVQAADAMKAYQHAQGKEDMQLTDYAFKCADVAPVGEPNGKVQAADAMIIYQQAQGKHSLW